MTEQGRLIDRYELMREIEKYFNPYDDWKTQIIADRIIHAPTIEERKKGKWKPISDGYVDIYECNQCGETEDYERNYCPNCGAWMGGTP